MSKAAEPTPEFVLAAVQERLVRTGAENVELLQVRATTPFVCNSKYLHDFLVIASAPLGRLFYQCIYYCSRASVCSTTTAEQTHQSPWPLQFRLHTYERNMYCSRPWRHCQQSSTGESSPAIRCTFEIFCTSSSLW
jgi:hypothetical protein